MVIYDIVSSSVRCPVPHGDCHSLPRMIHDRRHGCRSRHAPTSHGTRRDAIIMDHAKIQAVPELTANDIDAALIHEAAIGKIAGEQLIKLMTLGLTEEEAEAQIVNGFLK